jgi:hypothetical protein
MPNGAREAGAAIAYLQISTSRDAEATIAASQRTVARVEAGSPVE